MTRTVMNWEKVVVGLLKQREVLRHSDPIIDGTVARIFEGLAFALEAGLEPTKEEVERVIDEIKRTETSD